MTTSQMIDAVYQHWVNIGSATAGDALNRARLMVWLKQAIRSFRNSRPWPWSLAISGTVSLTANTGVGDMPSDFANITPLFKVFLQSAKHRLRYKASRLISEALERDTSAVSRPSHYCLQGMNATTFRQKILVYPINSAAITLVVRNYQATIPTLTDDQASPGSAADSTLKAAIPEQYHDTILFDYMSKRVEREKGGFRVPELAAEFATELAEAWALENPSQLPDGQPAPPMFGDEEEDQVFSY